MERLGISNETSLWIGLSGHLLDWELFDTGK
jgi:hypothetical protein